MKKLSLLVLSIFSISIFSSNVSLANSKMKKEEVKSEAKELANDTKRTLRKSSREVQDKTCVWLMEK